MGICIVTFGTTGGRWISLDDIQQQATTQNTYHVKFEDHSNDLTFYTVSVTDLVDRTVNFVKIENSSQPGVVATLSSDDLTDPAFDDGMPAFGVDYRGNRQATVLSYIRGQHKGAESTDVNGDDYEELAVDSGGYLTLTLETQGRLLHPSVANDTHGNRIDANDTVRFTSSLATSETVPPGVGYVWTFGDDSGRTTSAPTVPHRYTDPNVSPRPSVVVTGTDGSYGQGYGHTIQVGSAPRITGTGTGGPGAKTSGVIDHGPDTAQGTNPDSARSTGRNGAGTGSPRPGVSGATGGAGTGSAAATQPGAAASRAKSSNPPAAGGGEFVRGQALSDPQVVVLPGASAVTDPAVAIGARAPAKDSLDLTPLWLLLIPALIGVGALDERRRPRRETTRPRGPRNGART